MSNWCEYWSKSNLVKINDNSFQLINFNDSLNFFVDKRQGRTYGMIYLFSEPGSKGSVLARGEESSFLEEFILKGCYA